MQILKNHTTGEVESCETKNGNDIIKTVSGEPPNQAIYHYATSGVVGNGSFGVVFQATCVETSETVGPSPLDTTETMRSPAVQPSRGGSVFRCQVKNELCRWLSRRCCKTRGSRIESYKSFG